jgi:predicted permease
MITFLRIFFFGVLAVMIWVTTRASLETAVWQLPASLTGDLWFQATLADAYFGFLTFFVWLAYKETAWLSRIVWLVAILLLGNIAMATYCLIQLFRVPASADLREVLLRKPTV